MTDSATALALELRQQASVETRPEIASLLIRAAVRIGLDNAALAARDTLIDFHRQRADLALNDMNPVNFYRELPR